MSSFDNKRLMDALQDMKEAYLLALARRYISKKIPDIEILMLARKMPAPNVIRQLKRSYFASFVWNKMKRSWFTTTRRGHHTGR